MNDSTDLDLKKNTTIGEAEAAALAKCYRLLLQKAAEYRLRNDKNIEPAHASDDEVEGSAAKEHDSR